MKKDEIRKIRKSLKMTQQEFAALLGCSYGSVGRWEAGKFKMSAAYVQLLKQAVKDGN